MKYTYYQSGRGHTQMPSRWHEPSQSCLSAFVLALVTVVTGVMTFFVIYYGWIYLVRPLLQAWSTMLVIGG